MSYPLHPVVQPKKVKAHRRAFFQPIYVRDGFETQAAYDLYHWGKSLCERYASHPHGHHYARAIAALEVASQKEKS